MNPCSGVDEPGHLVVSGVIFGVENCTHRWGCPPQVVPKGRDSVRCEQCLHRMRLFAMTTAVRHHIGCVGLRFADESSHARQEGGFTELARKRVDKHVLLRRGDAPKVSVLCTV